MYLPVCFILCVVLPPIELVQVVDWALIVLVQLLGVDLECALQVLVNVIGVLRHVKYVLLRHWVNNN